MWKALKKIVRVVSEIYKKSAKSPNFKWSQPPTLPQQSRRYFRAENVTWLRLLFAIEYAYPARFVYRSP